ncbi:MAG: flagellar hook-associated protein FlgK [bacterium]|nr:flagellar hook-associated protein FlgK [bacterium]
MGTLFSALDIASSGMRTAQIQLDVTGHNIANVNKEGYSRQRVELASIQPNNLNYGQLGRGVGVDSVQRIRDAFLDIIYRQQAPELGTTTVLSEYYALIEDAFLEPSENGFGTRLNVFFDAMNDYANNVEETPVREVLLSEASALAGSLNELAARFDQLRTNANEEVRNLVPAINSLAERINEYNLRIRESEFAGQPANDLRDDRDVLVDELAGLINITYHEGDNGEVTILLGSSVLVDPLGARELEAVPNSSLDPERPDLVEVRWAETGNLAEVSSGELYGALEARDTVVTGIDERMDDVAAAIIHAINSIHSQSNGLENLSGTISSTNEVSAPGDALVSAGLPFAVTAGSFDVVVYDATNTAVTTTINITATTTLNDLATALNGVANFSASVSGNTLDMGTASPYTFTFSNDSSGALAALGVNGLFTGSDARTISVNADIEDHPEWLSSGYSLDPLNTGDNTAALAMADVRLQDLMDSGTSTVNEFYESTIANMGIDARANLDVLAVEQQFIDDFNARRQEVAGVNLDEEVTNLILYQRAYEASVRVINVTNIMLDALLSIAA